MSDLTGVGIAVSTWLSLDDDALWQRQTVRRMVNRLDPPTPTDVPGILFLLSVSVIGPRSGR